MTRYIVNPDVGNRLVIGRLITNPYAQEMSIYKIYTVSVYMVSVQEEI